MNVGLDCKNTAILAIVLSIISLACMALSFVLLLKKKDIKKYFEFGWSHRHTIFHVVSFFSLTVYVVIHWRECIRMQLFSRFNGNNILFFAWIILSFLLIYNIRIDKYGVFNRITEQEQKAHDQILGTQLDYQSQMQLLQQIQQAGMEQSKVEQFYESYLNMLKKGAEEIDKPTKNGSAN